MSWDGVGVSSNPPATQRPALIKPFRVLDKKETRRGLRGFRCVEPGLIPRLSKHGVSPEPSESLFQLNVCLTSPPLRSRLLPTPSFSSTSSSLFSLSYFPPACFWAIFISSASETFVFNSHYFSVLFHFFPSWSLVCLALLFVYFGWVFASQRHRFTALHWSTFSDRGACGVCTYHTQADWREGLWHWQIIERVQHVVQVIFLGETDRRWKQKAGNDTRVSFVSVVDAAQCINLNNGAGTEAAADQRAILQQGPQPSKTSHWHMFNQQRRG